MLTEFRDKYMMSTEEGKKLVDKYYEIAPKIVEAMNSSNKKDICYLYLNEIIEKCILFCEKEKYGYVQNEYRLMVKNFKKEFNL